MRLQILIPQYKETEDIIKPLLDSIEIQQNVDLKQDVGVIIVNDGTEVQLSRDFLDKYSYQIEYYLEEHRGVSATRNACLDRATAEYVMFCDADDMFYNACGLYIIFREIDKGGFDSLTSKFIEEIKCIDTQESIYVTHDFDSIFVHGKVHRRQYLIDQNIRWKAALTLHEDGYFNCLCQRLTKRLKYCPTPFYLWKWREGSVCRSDSLWAFKTYDHLIKANEALVTEFLHRGKIEEAQFYIVYLLAESYFTFHSKEWLGLEDKDHCAMVYECFKSYYTKFKDLFKTASKEIKDQFNIKLKNNKLLKELPSLEEWLEQFEKV